MKYSGLIILLVYLLVILGLILLGHETIALFLVAIPTFIPSGYPAKMIEQHKHPTAAQLLTIIALPVTLFFILLRINSHTEYSTGETDYDWYETLIYFSVFVGLPIVWWRLLLLIDLYTVPKHHYSCVSNTLHPNKNAGSILTPNSFPTYTPFRRHPHPAPWSIHMRSPVPSAAGSTTSPRYATTSTVPIAAATMSSAIQTEYTNATTAIWYGNGKNANHSQQLLLKKRITISIFVY